MNEDFAPYELAVKLKEKGFRELCTHFYRNGNLTPQEMFCGIRNNTHPKCLFNSTEVKLKDTLKQVQVNIVDAPTISQVLKWLREEKGMYIQITLFEYCYDYCILDTKMVYYDNEHKVLHQGPTGYSYDEAALAGIEYCLENLI